MIFCPIIKAPALDANIIATPAISLSFPTQRSGVGDMLLDKVSLFGSIGIASSIIFLYRTACDTNKHIVQIYIYKTTK